VTLPEDIALACADLFQELRLEEAMPRLIGSAPVHTELVEAAIGQSSLVPRPALIAALWLYVDDLERSHAVSQGIEGPVGAFWHGVMHRREGDFANSHYWMRQAASHPLFKELDPPGFVDDVARASGLDVAALVDRQREEWAALFEWCAHHS
jgi:hypothetical protein